MASEIPQETCSTPFGINGTNRSCQKADSPPKHVLNAFRHQRNKQRVGWDCLQNAVLCSTPFGINGTNSKSVMSSGSTPMVCSTPFGINGTNSEELCKKFPDASKCSTPFGINGTNSWSLQILYFRYLVLNAFRHQRNKQFIASIAASLA